MATKRTAKQVIQFPVVNSEDKQFITSGHADMSDVMAANEKVETYKVLLNQKKKELEVLQACLARNVVFPEVGGEKPLYCSEGAIQEEIDFYQKMYRKAVNQRDILWFDHMGDIKIMQNSQEIFLNDLCFEIFFRKIEFYTPSTLPP